MSEYTNLCLTTDLATVQRMWTAKHTWSEKLDGMRAIWDGGISKGRMTNEVPWAVTGPRGPQVCTGLFSRLGNPIYAPEWWTHHLGTTIRDGELWMGYDWRGDLLSIVKQGKDKSYIDTRWQRVRYYQYATPNTGFFRDRTFRSGKSRLRVCAGSFSAWDSLIAESLKKDTTERGQVLTDVVEHKTMPTEADFSSILHKGGEGIVVKDGMWRADRAGWYKVKPFQDMECTIVGYNSGLGRNSGRLGSYVCTDGKVKFSVSGMTDDERDKPRPIGSTLRVLYRVLHEGVPQECRVTSDRLGD